MRLALIGFGEKSCSNMKKTYELIAASDENYEADCFFAKEHELDSLIKEVFSDYEGLVFFSAVGIAVRLIAPHLKHKAVDPAVTTIDDGCNYCVALLSGHLGGANKLAGFLAKLLNAMPIVTTATDVVDAFSPDMYALKRGLIFDDFEMAKRIAAHSIEGGEVCIVDKMSGDFFLASKTGVNQIEEIKESCKYGILVSKVPENADAFPFENTLNLYPKNLILGIGCKRLTKKDTIDRVVNTCLQQHMLKLNQVYRLCSIDLKKDEEGLLAYAREHRLETDFFDQDRLLEAEKQLNNAGDYSESEFVRQVTGVGCVCEASVIAAGSKEILVHKFAMDGVTVAIGLGR